MTWLYMDLRGYEFTGEEKGKIQFRFWINSDELPLSILLLGPGPGRSAPPGYFAGVKIGQLSSRM